MFQIDATIGFKFDVHQNCRAPRALSYPLRGFLNPSGKFRTKIRKNNF